MYVALRPQVRILDYMHLPTLGSNGDLRERKAFVPIPPRQRGFSVGENDERSKLHVHVVFYCLYVVIL